MFKFLNKDLYCCIFLNTSDSNSTYITQIKKYNSPLYMNSYTFFFNMVGHSSLQTTQRYIEGDSESQRKVIDLI